MPISRALSDSPWLAANPRVPQAMLSVAHQFNETDPHQQAEISD